MRSERIIAKIVFPFDPRGLNYEMRERIYFVLLPLDSRRFLPRSRRHRVLENRERVLYEERLIFIPVRARINSSEIAHMVVFPLELSLHIVVLALLEFRRSRRVDLSARDAYNASQFIIYTANVCRISYDIQLSPESMRIIYVSLLLMPCRSRSLIRFLSSSIIFFLLHCCRFNMSKVSINNPSFTSLSTCASVWKLGE